MDTKGSASVRIRVPFYDVDMLQIVWHGHYLKYFDLARQALFMKCGFEMPQSREKRFSFPVVRTQVKYLYPLKFNDEFICTAKVRTAKVKIVIDFDIRLAADGRLCATGRSEHAAVRMPEMEMAFRIPEEVEKALMTCSAGEEEVAKPSNTEAVEE